MIHFITWIKQFNEIPKAIGDLARDIEADHIQFPRVNDYDVIKRYLSMEARASPDCIAVFEEAWNEYKLYLLAKDVDD